MHPRLAKTLRVEEKFHELFNTLRQPSLDVNLFILDEQLGGLGHVDDDDDDAGAAKASSAKPKAKAGRCAWKAVHEEFFLRFLPDTTWPPPATSMNPILALGFNTRSAEMIVAFNIKWPLDELIGGHECLVADVGQEAQWESFDANMSLERLCGYAPGGKPGAKVRSPWKRFIPCLTGGTQLVMRRRQGDDTIFKHLHPLEAFQMNGWHYDSWKQTEGDHGSATLVHPLQHRVGSAGHTPLKVLRHMAGNMWSCYHYVPVVMAAIGAHTWDGVRIVANDQDLVDASGAGSDDSDDGQSPDQQEALTNRKRQWLI